MIKMVLNKFVDKDDMVLVVMDLISNNSYLFKNNIYIVLFIGKKIENKYS